MTNRLLRFFAMLMLVGPCWCQSRGGRNYQESLEPIMSVLRRNNLSGSLEYWGTCSPMRIDFPAVTKPPMSDSAGALQVLREMFANDEKMQVTQEHDGTIRMVETDVPLELLNVKISHISFDDDPKTQYQMSFPVQVTWLITHAPEVQTFMKDHGIEQIPTMMNQASTPFPRVSGELNNVTLSGALDYMLKTFKGVWVYENCPSTTKGKRMVSFAFYRSGQ
jgi:hypothetical protein